MKTSTLLVIMYVVFCGFMIANWLNRPKKRKDDE